MYVILTIICPLSLLTHLALGFVILLCYFSYRKAIRNYSELAQVFDVVDNPVKVMSLKKAPVDKRQALTGALRKGKAHLLPKNVLKALSLKHQRRQ